MGINTDCIHAGQEPDPSTGAIMTPVYLTSTYVQPGLGKEWPYDYARTINPTRLALEKNLAVLERGKHGFAFASGMSAIHAIMCLLKAGDHAIVTHNVYGGTFRLFERVLRDYNLGFSWVDTSRFAAIRSAIRKNTRMIFIETPTNPMMTPTDIRAVARVCRKHGLISVVDNTFMTPYFQKPLEMGIDIVVHSTTKYLNGHSDSVGGSVITSNPKFAERIKFVQKSAGAILSPFESWLVLRGIKTLSVRMERHDFNGRKVAEFLARHRKVRRVFYPGLKDHPQHALAKKQMMGFGGMITFDVGTYRNARRLLNSVRLCSLAESLGGVETLISHPSSMTHASIPQEEQKKLGITEGLVRISVGIEDIEDIIDDLKRSLKAI
ncbi:MAG: PLP-dependent aspartate aminotransferase family protein [Acidobacteriota bacterium]